MKLVSVSEMQSVEREADAKGLTYDRMMEFAGSGLADAVLEEYGYLFKGGVLGLVGSGNNGGDTLVALSYLAQKNWPATAYLLRPRPQEDPLVRRLLAQGGSVYQFEDDPGFRKLEDLIRQNQVILDGVLGTGFRLPLKSELANGLGAARQLLSRLDKPPVVVAVDCPSGVDCDTGAATDECLPANLTVTMAAVKRGLLSFPAYQLVGKLRVAGIGIDESGLELKSWSTLSRNVVEALDVRRILPPRPLDAHKGTFGTALIAAGSANYTGAAWLAGEAAYRIGAGLVTLAVPAPLHSALAGQFPEATWILLPHEDGFISGEAYQVLKEALPRATALLVGPGFGLSSVTFEFINNLLSGDNSLRLPPVVIDADGLKLMSRISNWPKRLPAPAVLTPHPGEMSVLTGAEKDEIQANRIEVAEHYSRRWGHVVVLKGAFTVVADPGGKTSLIPVASPALARAGTGDVLAGLIAGLLAQGVDAFSAAVAGAWIHAQAGLMAAQIMKNTISVLAGDVLKAVPAVLSGL